MLFIMIILKTVPRCIYIFSSYRMTEYVTNIFLLLNEYFQLGAGGGGTVLEGDGDGSCSMADGLDHEGHRLLYGIALIHATFRERNAAFGAYAGGEGLAGWGRRGFLAAVESVRKACLGLGSTTTSTEVKVRDGFFPTQFCVCVTCWFH